MPSLHSEANAAPSALDVSQVTSMLCPENACEGDEVISASRFTVLISNSLCQAAFRALPAKSAAVSFTCTVYFPVAVSGCRWIFAMLEVRSSAETGLMLLPFGPTMVTASTSVAGSMFPVKVTIISVSPVFPELQTPFRLTSATEHPELSIMTSRPALSDAGSVFPEMSLIPSPRRMRQVRFESKTEAFTVNTEPSRDQSSAVS